jgi:hypothetical protein
MVVKENSVHESSADKNLAIEKEVTGNVLLNPDEYHRRYSSIHKKSVQFCIIG